ncbi:MAG TPA: outer membrane lipoprotein carrier protein LolA [Sandaracinaceae bacterium]
MRDRRHRPSSIAAALALGALSLAALAPLPRAAVAQERADAATVAAWVQTFYDQTRTMSARFEQRYRNRVYQRTETSRGRVRFEKPGKMRFDYDQPNGKIIVSDGQQLTVYEPPDAPGASGQYYQQPMSDAQLPAALSFLTGTGRLDRDFTFREGRAELYPEGRVLELRSRRPTPHYSRILLFVDDDPARRGVVHRVIIQDQAGNTNQFNFTEQQFNRDIDDSVFRWRPPARARRIQP